MGDTRNSNRYRFHFKNIKEKEQDIPLTKRLKVYPYLLNHEIQNDHLRYSS